MSGWPPPASPGSGEPPSGGTAPGPWPPPSQGGPPGAQAGVWQQPAAREPGGVLLRAGHSPLAFLLAFCRPRVSIDASGPVQLRWGENPLPAVAPGRHHVRVWFRYLFYRECGVADAWIDVPPQGTFLEYKAPTWFVFNNGSFPNLVTGGAAPGAATASGAWYPDPLGRADQRWWDGRQWTGHVARSGQQTWDPL